MICISFVSCCCLVVGCCLSFGVHWHLPSLFVVRCLVSLFVVVCCLLIVVDSWLLLFGPWFVVLVLGDSFVVLGSYFWGVGSLLCVLSPLLFYVIGSWCLVLLLGSWLFNVCCVLCVVCCVW